MTIKKIVFVLGVLALGFTATAPARADYAIVSFHSGYCRIWTYTDVVPPDGAFVWFGEIVFPQRSLPVTVTN
jgi:hypothetical protein